MERRYVAGGGRGIDVDATILESHKRSALATYDGRTGYQPVVALWAEQDVILADEFRDGNVPAGTGNRRVVEQALAALPGGVEQVQLRADSALYEQALLRWLEGRGIGYVISADMSHELAAAIRALPESAWQIECEDGDAIRQWTEVAYVPSDGVAAKDRPAPPRYLALRITKKQGRLFADGAEIKHFAIVTNLPDPDGGSGLDLIHFQRGKAGTVEHSHHVLTNELAAEALPSQRFGANAAWFRLNVLLYNLLSAFKRIALPEALHHARPKRLRFVLLNGVGRVAAARPRDRAEAGRRRASQARRRRPSRARHRTTARHRRLSALARRPPSAATSHPARQHALCGHRRQFLRVAPRPTRQSPPTAPPARPMTHPNSASLSVSRGFGRVGFGLGNVRGFVSGAGGGTPRS